MSQTRILIQAFIWSKSQRGYVLFSQLIEVLCLI